MQTTKPESLNDSSLIVQSSHCSIKDYEACAHIARSKLFHSYLQRINRYYRNIKHNNN
jgi:hypothetical protein